MSEYSLDDAIYVAVIRSSEPKNGHEVKLVMEAFKEAGIKPVTQPAVVAFEGRECSSQKHDALKTLGFTFAYANSHIPVVVENPDRSSHEGAGND